MEKAFVYGMSVDGSNFTDRIKETKRLKMDFEGGMNVILISPRRMGKTSLVRHVQAETTTTGIKVVYMDIYDCRSEYDFYNRFATALMRATSSKMEQVLENIKRFLVRVSPKISFNADDNSEFSISLSITPKDYSPEEILNLPEAIAADKGVRVVVCIDEFQQVGEFRDSLSVQKKLRGVWQHQRKVSYCLFGSKRHLMENMFQSARMPFYLFGEMMYLDTIPTEYWIPFICSRFNKYGKIISENFAKRICEAVNNYSSYVQQLSWNVMAETVSTVDEDSFEAGVKALLAQCSSLFVQQTQGLTTYQLNLIRAICSGIHAEFGSKETLAKFPLGSKSNIEKIKNALRDREIIDIKRDGAYLTDVVFEHWFKVEMM